MKYYQNPDNDPRGPWNSATYTCNKTKDERPNLFYPITNPFTGKEVWPKETAVWAYSKDQCDQHIEQNLLFWGSDGTAKFPRFKKLLANHQGVVNRTLWHYDDVNHTQGASEELKKFEIEGFATPKPSRLIKRMIQISCNTDSIILDFFSGSATTAHAVMQLNAEDGGNRKYIMVQIPEPTDDDSESHRAGYKTIADIGKMRIRRVGDQILQAFVQSVDHHQLPEEGDGYGDGQGYGDGDGDGQGAGFGNANGEGNLDRFDVGFRVFKLDSSNLQKWDGSYVTPENADLFLNRAEHSLDNMKPDRGDIDMVYEVFLKYGVPLTEKLATLQIQDKTFYVVGDTGYLMICLDKDITVETVEETVKTHTPGAIIFADECFMDDNELTNAGLALDKAHVEFRWI